jgi:Uncharacterized conserved protein
LVGDTRTKTFAAVHAGWRGTVQSIIIKAVESMRKEYGSEPKDLIAAVGPCATGSSYEVGPEVIAAFEGDLPASDKYFTTTRDGHALVDLPLANMDQLLSCGVTRENIYIAPFCTIARTDLFFSYRIEKPLYGRTGRLMSVIGIDGSPLNEHER